MNDDIGDSSNERNSVAENPQSGDNPECNGQVVLGVGVGTLKRVETHLDWGEWAVLPADNFTGPGANSWKAQAVPSQSRERPGVAGQFRYQTGDDALINIHFYVPSRGDNDVYIYATGKNKDKYECSVTLIPRRNSISPVYTINKKV